MANSSTSFSVADLLAWASSTSRINLATAELSAVAVARTRRGANPLFTVPPDTASSRPLRMGRDSPVSEDSSTVDTPSSTTPSQGTFSPGRTETRAPTGTHEAGTTVSSCVVGCTMLARSGRSCTMADSARRAREVARTSSHSEMENKKTNAAASEYSWSASAPMEANNMRQLASSWKRRIVRRAFKAMVGRPNNTDRRPTYLR